MNDLFAGTDFAWSIRMRRDDQGAFFVPRQPGGSVLARKNHWLDSAPELCLADSESGQILVDQIWDFAEKCCTAPAGGSDRTFEKLGRVWEADFILLNASDFTIAGGCVCFPSSWNLQESTGKTLDEVHGIVPGLTESLGPKIDRFLRRIPDGQAFLRENWGLTRTAHLNYHPEMKRARLDNSVSISDVFLRIEHQAFVRLPDGILLGVRIEPVGLPDLIEKFPETARRLRSQLETMPEEVAAYKSLDAGRERVIELLGSALV